MALSNWDTMAFDENGMSSNGVLEGFVEGTNCEIYKNWLYVRDDHAWVEDREYVRPTIAQVNHGNLNLSGFEINAVRGPQDSIFVRVECRKYHEQEKGEDYIPPDVRRMAGIGASGYEDHAEKVAKEEGLDPEEWELFTRNYASNREDGAKLGFNFIKVSTLDDEESEFKEFYRSEDYDAYWVGVKESTVKEFIQWLRDDGADKEWVDKIEKAEPIRFNQGDAFFNKHAGVPLHATPPGEGEEPFMIQAIKNSQG